jgi:hypothetical protein
MSTTIKNIKIPYPTEGVIRSAQLSDTVCPENSVQLAVNMNFDRIGAITSRPGMTTFATTLTGSVISFGTLNIQSSATRRLFSQVGTDISVWNGSTWTSVRTATVSTKARFSQWLDRVWMVNGNAGDAPKTSNGGAFDTTDVPATLPKGDFIQAGFDGRVWIGNKAKDFLYYTDIVQSTDGSSYVSPLTFDITTNFITKFSSQNGESMTGIWRVPRALLIFKQNHIYRVYSPENVDPYPAYNVGTYSQESIVETKEGLFFHHSSGFYKFAYDGQPVEISRRVIDFVKAIPRAYYESVKGIWDGADAVEWHVGPITVEGVSYTNCVMRYSLSTQVWTTYDYPNHSFSALIRYDDGTTLNMIAGTSTGVVANLDKGILDIDKPIYYEIIDRWRSFTEMYADRKSLSGISVFSENAGGAMLEYQLKKDIPNEWSYLGEFTEDYSSPFKWANTEDFNVMRFRVKGNNSGTPIIIHGIEVLSIQKYDVS